MTRYKARLFSEWTRYVLVSFAGAIGILAVFAFAGEVIEGLLR